MQEAPASSKAPKRPGRVLLRTSELTKSFGSFQVLKGLNLSVREGQVYGFLGRNGAGKTTSIQILMGIQKADRGRLSWFGEFRQRPGVVEKQQIGYVSQEQFFYPWMTCRYLGRFVSRFYPSWDMTYYSQLLDTFSLPAKRKVVNLSQGMRVKLALALALAHRPKILILDEPTAGLDPAARREFLDIASYQADHEGRTTLFSSHIVEEVERISDRVGILREGRLCYQGSLTRLGDLVRQIQLPEPFAPQAPNRLEALQREARLRGFEVLQKDVKHGSLVMRAEPRAWHSWQRDHQTVESRLSLEDIFLGLTVERDLIV